MSYFKFLLIIGLAGFIFSSCSSHEKVDDVKQKALNEAKENDPSIHQNTIIQIAPDHDLKTFVKALKSAGLYDLLNNDQPKLTVFAPADEAFGNWPEGKLDSLMKPENKEKLRTILKYHIIEDSVMTSDLENRRKLTTLEGNDVEITKKNGVTKINDATVTKADIIASNGVIHVIDKVLTPIKGNEPK